ncbi:MAG TPA: hypothetical protein VK607_01155, partial [Kofleriaceae bacterium]|nr:hypothetical protein [Kofleriaceae bacterium]
SAGGSQLAAAPPRATPTAPTSPTTTPPTPTPPAVRADAPLAFERSQIRLDSTPSHAEVRDLSNGKLLGRTPLPFTLTASRTPRQFSLHRTGYVDAVVEIVPDQAKLEYTQPLERGASSASPVVHHATEPGRPPATPATPDGPAIKPDPTRIDPVKPETRPEVKPEIKPEVKPPPQPPPPEDEIMLKPDPSRAGSGSSAP